jgi:hypothetical protein
MAQTKAECAHELRELAIHRITEVRRPICPVCSEAMVRIAVQEHDDGSWFLVWLCACQAPPDKYILDVPCEMYFHDNELLAKELKFRG